MIFLQWYKELKVNVEAMKPFIEHFLQVLAPTIVQKINQFKSTS